MLKSVATTSFACVVLEHSIAVNLATPDKFARTPRFLQRLDKQLGLPNISARVIPLVAIPTARVQLRIRPTASPVKRVQRCVKSGGGWQQRADLADGVCRKTFQDPGRPAQRIKPV